MGCRFVYILLQWLKAKQPRGIDSQYSSDKSNLVQRRNVCRFFFAIDLYHKRGLGLRARAHSRAFKFHALGLNRFHEFHTGFMGRGLS